MRSRCVRFNSFRDYLLPFSALTFTLPLSHFFSSRPSLHNVVKMRGCKSGCVRSWENFLDMEKLTENFTSHRSLANQQKKTTFLHRYNNHAYISLTQLSFSVCVGVCGRVLSSFCCLGNLPRRRQGKGEVSAKN